MYSHTNYTSLCVLPVLKDMVLSLSLLFRGSGMQIREVCGGCRGEQLLAVQPHDAAERWHCRSLFYVEEDGHAGGKDRMC